VGVFETVFVVKYVLRVFLQAFGAHEKLIATGTETTFCDLELWVIFA